MADKNTETMQAWCKDCDSEQTFYRPTNLLLTSAPPQKPPFRCSLCEHVIEDALDPDLAQGETETATSEPEQPVGQAVGDGTPLQDDLDHIRVVLSGPWTNEDLKNLAADLQMSADGAKEGGLGLAFFAVKKTEAQKARSAGGIIVPFKDRHGRIIPGRALSLSPNRIIPGGKS